ncbi:hypothetical protein GCM10010954_00610 [Halobacillus andaensis]|uniref:DUF4247 domain-containing protein n=1 Tax=Halobacillus andaensis TaxID=1176239 RepID=A0A917EUJ5_HALAA|nr:DUF4247 domain-containing protein [Halobacillus andaensis]MBP2002848.1 hypothetical protein [Halobacillus andaensis]GGF06128.1 hypothetical protein GCM10010954_00610 [Halobacillus andaensis]
MRDYAGVIIVVLIAIVIGYNAFGSMGNGSRGMSGSNAQDTYEELPSEPSKSEVLNSIDQSEATSIRQLLSDSFPLLDTVETDEGHSEIFMTQNLTLPETAEEIENKIEPEEVSDRDEGKQVLIYPDEFVILQESEEEPGLILIELASDEFVRNNYSPSFFQGLLAYSLLNRMLGSSDWANRREARCQSEGGCYGGYSMYGGSNSGSFRGSSNRGGGPGTGK